ncbi:MAG: ATP-binding cassette domain-containing protein [Caldisericia bacterium]|nr:ATP-binding cassette domain-containing protein [Caldisericia bacterium]MDD4615105.1 ATP-binding cassette domain-containing protein [Caldisericia bacterium]
MPIQINHLSFTYDKGLVYEKEALKDITMTIPDQGIIGIIGHSGSGKSTLIQHFNGLILPQKKNTILVDGTDLYKVEGSLSWLRKKVGLVFQYPENQLFEETIEKELAFGPKNLGIPEKDIPSLIRHSLELVGLKAEEYLDRSPFTLSGGEKRKIAIADILAMNPTYLVLDEPTAGLDPVARKELLLNIVQIQKQQNMTVVIVSHDMEEIASVSEYVYVMSESEIKVQGPTLDVFSQCNTLRELQLDVPEPIQILSTLQKVDPEVCIRHVDVQGTTQEILSFLERKRGDHGV